MKTISIYSLNINGIRASYKKGFHEWLVNENPGILCLQEIRSQLKDLPCELTKLKGYHSFWFPGEKPGYSGTAIFSKMKPILVSNGLNRQEFDTEGRVIIIEYLKFYIINCYVPNGRSDHSRLEYKFKFYRCLLKEAKKLSKIKNVIICGDFNVAHTELDLASPMKNLKKTGFLPKERKYFDNFISNSFKDVHREFNPNEKGLYTWWNSAHNLKGRNLGWRFDYFLISKSALPRIIKSIIHTSIELSDHCPISIEYEFDTIE